ncbi:MAG: hypothetical protein M3R53_04210 [Candidatus Eremiobacteraeota bacterium]|nr:hypothetical protein [Candidatus Eremiobacteraeota bacterium]
MNAAVLFARWEALPRSARIVAGTLAAALLLVMVLAGVFAHTSGVALFANPLQPDQLNEVQEQLAGWNSAFTPTADNVIVAQKDRNELLLRLSLAGVPHAQIQSSSELLGKVGALTPQAVVDAQTRDGLAGDIELGLRGMDGIEDARVIVAPAKRGYFADERSYDASASVRVKARAGMRLSREAVAGIRAFVAASVPGLDRARVTIVDDRGVALGSGGDSSSDANDLQTSLQSALDLSLGAGASIVRVRTEFDDRSQQSRFVRQTPLTAPPVTSTTENERYSTAGKRYDRTQAQVQRGTETSDVSTSTQPGRLARISVAIFVDASRQIDLYKVRALASGAAGLDARRGDSITVQAIPFSRARSERKDGWWLAYGAIVPLLPTVAIAVALLVAVRWMADPLAQFAKSITARVSIARTTAAVSGIGPAQVRGALLGEPPHAAAAIISALPAATAAAVLDMYPEHERTAIVQRMQRQTSPLVGDAEQFIENA